MDFGYRNEWVGICHAVMDKVAPGVHVIDLDSEQWGLLIDPRGWLSVIRGEPGNAAEGLGVGGGDLRVAQPGRRLSARRRRLRGLLALEPRFL
jgi:hypothetical protein